MNNKTITISLELAQKIADYLSTRPFAEVVTLINELQKQANQVETVPQEEKPSKKNEK